MVDAAVLDGRARRGRARRAAPWPAGRVGQRAARAGRRSASAAARGTSRTIVDVLLLARHVQEADGRRRRRRRAACAAMASALMPCSAAFSLSTTKTQLRVRRLDVPVDVDDARRSGRRWPSPRRRAAGGPRRRGRRPRRPASAGPAVRAAPRPRRCGRRSRAAMAATAGRMRRAMAWLCAERSCLGQEVHLHVGDARALRAGSSGAPGR